MTEKSSIADIFSDMGHPDSWELGDFQTAIRQRLLITNPARLDLTESPVTAKDLDNLGDELSRIYREVYWSHHRNATFILDMIHCMNIRGAEWGDWPKHNDGNKSRPVFHPSMLLPECSHKRSIHKLDVRLTLSHFDHRPDPKEINWLRRTFENIPSFTNLRSLHVNFNHRLLYPIVWQKYKNELNSCLDRLPVLTSFRISLPEPGGDFERVDLVSWLSERYGSRPMPTATSYPCIAGVCRDMHGRRRVPIIEELGEYTEGLGEPEHYEWSSSAYLFDGGQSSNLEFENEAEEDDDGYWDQNMADDYDDDGEVLQIRLPSKDDEGGEVNLDMSFEEQVAALERELLERELLKAKIVVPR